MSRLICKIPYIKAGRAVTQRAGGYIKYISTREGVEKLEQKSVHDKELLPATKKQQKMVRQLTHDFPESRSTFEYEDYKSAPTRKAASEFISRTLEEHYDEVAGRENYVRYISDRPRVQRLGSHGLFTGSDKPVVLSQVAEEVEHHPGNIWTPILSLKREDASRLGYDNAQRWKDLLTSHAPEIAQMMKIPLKEFRWYAAFHDEGSHPHVHMICYSADGKSGFLTKDGLDQIRSMLARDIFEQDMISIYKEQTQRRDDLSDTARETLEQLIVQIQSGAAENPRLGQLMEQLSERLQHTSGKKKYGYLPPAVKAQVDEIVEELEKDPQVEKAYALWYDMREEVLRSYKDSMPPRVPLSQQKEFRSIKNIIVTEADRLGKLSSIFIEDDTGPKEADEPDFKPSDEMKTVWQQAAEYRNCKEILYESEAPPEEKRAALASLEQLYDSGFVVAAHLLGKVYRDGVIAEPDENAAEWWFHKSASAGNDYSQYALGKLLESQGRINEAAEWLSQAADQSNRYAQYRLAKLLLTGEDIPKDVEEAVRLLTASAEQGNQYAQYTLGKLYLLGKEVPQDRQAATHWFTMAADQGNQYAQYFLQHIEDWRRAAISQGIGRLMHHLGNLFRAQAPAEPTQPVKVVDRKLLRKIREKKAALGIKSEGMQHRY